MTKVWRIIMKQYASNIAFTVDGAWNFDGRAMSNEEIGEAISKG